jgi:hypothetical protein
MTTQFRLIAFAACLATISALDTPTAQAMQQCSAAVPSDSHGYWSWRLIDGRKCWYEGKPMLSKSLLQWPANASAQVDPGDAAKNAHPEKPSDPMDANAMASDSDSFEALWRARVEKK